MTKEMMDKDKEELRKLFYSNEFGHVDGNEWMMGEDSFEFLWKWVENKVNQINGETLKTINEFFEDYLLDKDKCFYIDSLKFKNNLHFAALIIRQLKIDLLSRLSV